MTRGVPWKAAVGAAGVAGPHWACPMCSLVGVEALVGWLLDHADVQVTDLSDADTGSEECSDEEGVDEVDDTAYAMVSAARASLVCRAACAELPLSVQHPCPDISDVGPPLEGAPLKSHILCDADF